MSSIVFVLTAFLAGWVFLRLKNLKSGFIFGVVFYVVAAVLSLVVSLVGLLVLASLIKSDSAVVAIDKVVAQSVLFGLVAPLVGVVLFKIIARKNTGDSK